MSAFIILYASAFALYHVAKVLENRSEIVEQSVLSRYKIAWRWVSSAEDFDQTGGFFRGTR
jgi:hypothetical protein